MQLSHWEFQNWLEDIDFTIVGSGIVGLQCALSLRELHPHANIRIIEKGILPEGASTKNAGFACFGSVSEILDDLKHHTIEDVVQLVERRWKGLMRLRQRVPDNISQFKNWGGNEIFLSEHADNASYCFDQIEEINNQLYPVFKQKVFHKIENNFGFKNIVPQLISTPLEGQIDSGAMMRFLIQEANRKNIFILNGVELLQHETLSNHVSVLTNLFEFNTRQLILATNGFSQKYFPDEVVPARAQVMITHPIKDLTIKGNFHFNEGFFYFRNVGNRVLFGGGRNLDLKGEATTKFGITTQIQDELTRLLSTVILPQNDFKIDRQWSGIMGMGPQKSTILRTIDSRTTAGVRLGGMGVALGSQVGHELALLATSQYD